MANDDEPTKKKSRTDKDAPKVETPSKDDDGDDDVFTPSGKRRFFPRVKLLLAREWEYFLTGVLDALEEAGAPGCASASHKLSNPWYKAFDSVYNGIANDCSMPTGKNRYHKFKDKIVELWVAMEQSAADDHPQKQRALDQLAEYRKACQQQGLANKEKADRVSTPKSAQKDPSSASASKRTYSSTIMGARWKHLNEMAALQGLPEPLQSLVHLRGLTAEVSATANAALETLYQNHLEEYLAASTEDSFAKCQTLVALSRQTQTNKEQRDICDAYESLLADYVVGISPSTATV